MNARPLNRSTKRWSQRLSSWENEPYQEHTVGVEPNQADVGLRQQSVTNETLSILLIDDEPGIRLLLSKGLTNQGHQLYEADDGLTGLAQFHAVQPDIILLDVNLPGMDGFTILKEIRRYDGAVGILMCSAVSAKFLINEALHSGADRYLIKPIRLQTIFTEVQRVGNLVRQRRCHYP